MTVRRAPVLGEHGLPVGGSEERGVRTSWGSATDRGLVRRINEDALLAYPPVFLVADGMGGHAAGDVASRLAVEEFAQLAGRPSADPDEIHACFRRTARRLRTVVDAGRTAGTTVAGVGVAAYDGAEYWLVFNIGDSRVYRLAGGRLEQISVDHSVVQELIDRGELDPAEASAHPERHVVTRAIATHAEPSPDYWLIPAGPADRLLVCTDGLTIELSDARIREVLTGIADPQEAAERLVAEAVAAGGRDNVSAVVVDVATASSRPGVDDPTGRSARAAEQEEIWGATVPRFAQSPGTEGAS
jgi:protein phosphatase